MWATKAVDEATKDYVNSGNWIAEFVDACLDNNKYGMMDASIMNKIQQLRDWYRSPIGIIFRLQLLTWESRCGRRTTALLYVW